MAVSIVTPSRRHGNRQMLYLVERYQAAHPDAPEVDPYLVAEWAIEEGLWKRPPMDPKEILRRLIGRALRDEYVIDPQGREVRAHHPIFVEEHTAAGIKRRSKWYPIFEMEPKLMRASLALRRRAALADVMQLHLDFTSYNDNNTHHEQLEPLDFDFNKDIEEASLPTKYLEDDPELEAAEKEEEEEEDV